MLSQGKIRVCTYLLFSLDMQTAELAASVCQPHEWVSQKRLKLEL